MGLCCVDGIVERQSVSLNKRGDPGNRYFSRNSMPGAINMGCCWMTCIQQENYCSFFFFFFAALCSMGKEQSFAAANPKIWDAWFSLKRNEARLARNLLCTREVAVFVVRLDLFVL